MHTLIIRDMKEEDIPQVLEIERASFSTPCTANFFLNAIYGKNALSKVALYEERVVGYLCAEYLLHESHILVLAVHPDFRRRGVAGILMSKAAGELKEKGCVFAHLKVRVSSAGAQKFYERLGFKVESFRKRYYGDPDEDALQMVGRL